MSRDSERKAMEAGWDAAEATVNKVAPELGIILMLQKDSVLRQMWNEVLRRGGIPTGNVEANFPKVQAGPARIVDRSD